MPTTDAGTPPASPAASVVLTPPRKEGGRPPVPISDVQRRQIAQLAGIGCTDAEIARIVLGASETTLQRRCRAELDQGRAEAAASVKNTLYRLATSGRSVAATIFWLKARANWREVNAVELTGGAGGPIALEAVRERLLEKLARAAEEGR